MFKKQKGFSIILVIIALVIIAGGILVWSYNRKTPKQKITTEHQTNMDQKANLEKSVVKKTDEVRENAKWKVYKNEKYGYEVSYPKDWVVQEDRDEYIVLKLPDVPFERVRKGGIKTGKIVNTIFKVAFDIDTVNQYQSINDYMEQSGMNDTVNWRFDKPILTNLGGTDFYYYSWVHQLEGERYFTLLNGHPFSIRFIMNNYGAENPDFFDMKKTSQYAQFRKMLSTFKIEK